VARSSLVPGTDTTHRHFPSFKVPAPDSPVEWLATTLRIWVVPVQRISPRTTSSWTPSRLASVLWASYVGERSCGLLPFESWLSPETEDLDLGDLAFSSRYLTHSVNGSPPPVLLINHNQRSLSTSRISQQTCSVCLLATTPAARDELA
jgi:hypothetical protein